MAHYFAESVAASFKNSALPLTSKPGKHVLTASFALETFTPTAPKDDAKSRGTNTEIYTYNVGDLTMKGIISSSTTGAVLGLVKDTQTIGDTPYLEKNDRISNARKLKRTFNRWTSDFAAALNEFIRQ